MGEQIDLSPNSLTPQQKTLLERSGGFNFQQIPTGNWRGIVLRTDMKPFDDVRVRRAIRLAVDRKALIDLAAGGLGTIACDTPVAPTDMYRWNGTCNQDIAKAKALLAEAGFPTGSTWNCRLPPSRPSGPAWPRCSSSRWRQQYT